MKIKTAVVTGGLGFIGSHIIERLLSMGIQVVNIDCKTYAAKKDTPFKENSSYSEINRNINDLEELPDADILIHCAAETSVDQSFHSIADFYQTNVAGTAHLIKLLRGRKTVFFHFSTDEVYGPTFKPANESAAFSPTNPYSHTKVAAEMIVQSLSQAYKIPLIILRLSNNYGIGQHPEKFISYLIQQIRQDKKIQIHGTGNQNRTWTWVDDTVEALFRLIDLHPATDSVYNICTNEQLSLLDIIAFATIIQHKTIDDLVSYIQDRAIQDQSYTLDNSKILATGWKPALTLRQYLQEALQNSNV